MQTILMLVLATAVVAADPRPGDEGTPEHQKAAELVKQLGDKRFAVREAAAKKLIEMGGAAVPALTAGTGSNDEEVRNRSIALLPQAKAALWQRRAEAYLNDKDGKEKHDLPLLADFEKLVGKPDAGSRKMFAEMVRTNGELLETTAAHPKAAKEAVRARCRTVLGRVGTVRKPIAAEVGDLAALFFVHGRVDKDRASWSVADHPAHLLNNPGLAEVLAAKDLGPSMRRVLFQWAESQPAEDHISNQLFALAVRNAPFPEAVPVLARLAKDKKAPSLHVRAVAVQALGKVGDGEAKATLEGLTSDTTSTLQGIVDQEYPLGDTAFAALINAHGKKPADYGVTEGIDLSIRAGTRGESAHLTLSTFANAGSRQAGLKKWKDEAAKK